MLLFYLLCSFSSWVMASTATKEGPMQSLMISPSISTKKKLQGDMLSPDVRTFISKALGDGEQGAIIVAHTLNVLQLDPVYSLGSLMQRKFAAEASLGALRNIARWKMTDMKSLFLKSKDDSDLVSMLIIDLGVQQPHRSATSEYAILEKITELRCLLIEVRISLRMFKHTAARDGYVLEDKQDNFAHHSSLIITIFNANRAYLRFCQHLRFFLRLHLQMLRKRGEDTKDNEEASRKWQLLYRTISRNSLRPIRAILEEATRHLPWLYFSLFVNLLRLDMCFEQTPLALLLEGPCSPAKFSDAPRSLQEWQHCLQKYAKDGRLPDPVRRELLDVKYSMAPLFALKLDATMPWWNLLNLLMAHAMAIAYRERFWLDSLLDELGHNANSDNDHYDDHGGETGKSNAQDKEEESVLKADDWKIVADVEYVQSTLLQCVRKLKTTLEAYDLNSKQENVG
jgi:hypothetical protein